MGLTEAQRAALGTLSTRRPIAGNDDGWLNTSGIQWRTVRALERAGCLERNIRGASTRDALMFRLTPAGRAALQKDASNDR